MNVFISIFKVSAVLNLTMAQLSGAVGEKANGSKEYDGGKFFKLVRNSKSGRGWTIHARNQKELEVLVERLKNGEPLLPPVQVLNYRHLRVQLSPHRLDNNSVYAIVTDPNLRGNTVYKGTYEDLRNAQMTLKPILDKIIRKYEARA